MTKDEGKKRIAEREFFNLESDDFEKTLSDATGVSEPKFQNQLLADVVNTMWLPERLSAQERNDKLRSAVTALEGIKPVGAQEGLLATQMVATHNAAIECLRRAMLEKQPRQSRDQNLKHATKLLSLFTQQLATLDKHRGKGQQKVTVEHVNVEAGGQAIVGNVEGRTNIDTRSVSATTNPDEIENNAQIPIDAEATKKKRGRQRQD